MILKRFSLIAVCLIALSVPANAVVNSYTVEAAYNAAVGSQLFLIDFDGLPVGLADGNFAGMVDFGSPEASDPSKILFNSDAMSDAGSTVASNSVGPVDGVFASPVYAFAMVFSSSENPQILELYDVSNTLIGTAVSNPSGFFGVVSDAPVASFVIRNGQFSSGDNDRFFVDDFRANAPVPEPGTLFLLGSGIASLGAVYRRRKK